MGMEQCLDKENSHRSLSPLLPIPTLQTGPKTICPSLVGLLLVCGTHSVAAASGLGIMD